MRYVNANMLIALAASAALLGGVGGCERERRVEPLTAFENPVEFGLVSSHREVVVGEVVTVTTETRNLFGRAADIEWSANGGIVETEQNGRVARVRFEQPGTYTIMARLRAEDDSIIRTDSVNVNVRPLTPESRFDQRDNTIRQRDDIMDNMNISP